MLKLVITIIIQLLLLCSISLAQQEQDIIHGSPPGAKPQRISGAEGFPPLPLPVVPLRRTEQKRPPQPLALISKIKYVTGEGWRGHISDVKQMLDWASPQLGISYTNNEVILDQFSFDANAIPIIYFTGHKKIVFTDEQKKKIYKYLVDGGTILGNACCGNTVFTESFRKEFENILPQRSFQIISSSHPIYSSFFKVEKINYIRSGQTKSSETPRLEGVNLGCRLAVILSTADLSSGWDNVPVPTARETIQTNDALKIGANIVAYVLAFHKVGKNLAKESVYETNDKSSGGEFTFAQVVHNGDWDPHPGAITQFLKKLGATTMSNVQYNRISVHLTKDDLTNHPFIYMTGHTDFQFSQTDAAKLTKYLYNGGFLLVNCCCGSSEFDLAFRRELKKIFPNNDLTELPPTHPVFNSFYTIDQVEYTQKASQSRAGNKEPYLEGIMAKDYAMVLYSKYGMAWDQQIRPYTKTYQPEDSIKLGINSIVYALSH